MHLKLTDSNVIMFIYRLLYKDLISAANQNCITDIPSKKKNPNLTV